MLQKVLWIFAVTTNHDLNIQVFCFFSDTGEESCHIGMALGSRMSSSRTGDGCFFVVFFTTFTSPWICKTSLYFQCIHTYIIASTCHIDNDEFIKKPASRHVSRNNRRIWEHRFHTRVPDRRQIEEGQRKRSQIGLIYSFWGSSGLRELLAVSYSSRFKSVHNNKQREFQLFVFSWLCDRKKKPANS